ncbi:MAG: hypothetical protein GEU98_27780 [Pseudonocardiaceae bacterium]|nr:hypothetical protein [Pseudonocardiaceae bacterium]
MGTVPDSAGGSRVPPAVPGRSDTPPPAADGRRAHLAGAAVVLAIGVAAIVGALQLGYWARGPGPGFFPLWMGVLLTAMAAAWAVQSYRAGPIVTEKPPAGSRRQVLLVLAGLLGVVLLLNVLGYQLTMFLFVLYVLLVVSKRRWLEALVFAAVAGIGVYALFANVLQVYLPTASLGFLAQLGL